MQATGTLPSPSPATVARDPQRAQVSRRSFLDAAAEHGVPAATAEAIWSSLGAASRADARGAGLRSDGVRFADGTRLTRAVRVLLYVGAVLVIGSYGWWAAEVEFGPGPLLALSLLYGAAFVGVALASQRRGLDELVGVAATIAAFYVPVAAYAALRTAGFEFAYAEDGVAAFYEWIDGGWVWLELAGIAGAAALYRTFRAPLLMLPLSLLALFLAMDGAARAVGLDTDDDAQVIGAFVLGFAVAAVVAGVALDLRGLRRHAVWPHAAAAVGVLCALELLLAEHSFELALLLSGVAFLAAGVALGRVGYLVFGGLSLWVGITALAPSPFVLTLSGLGLVAAAVWLSLAQSPLRRWLQSRTLPAPQRD